MQSFNKLFLAVAASAVSIVFTGCGGGSDNNKNNINQQKPIVEKEKLVEKEKPIVEKEKPAREVELSLVNKLSLERLECGFGGLEHNQDLEEVSKRHANYIKHINTNVPFGYFNVHLETKLKGIEQFTGESNPYFTGRTVGARVRASKYPYSFNTVSENIAQKLVYQSNDVTVGNEQMGLNMYRLLMAAPYHLRSMVSTDIKDVGVSFLRHDLFERDPKTNQGFVLVFTGGAGKSDKGRKGVFDIKPTEVLTYPCDETKGVATALTNESPNPFGNSRNLKTNPVGQSVYIRSKSGKPMVVSNVRYTDVNSGLDIPVHVLNTETDPYKNTGYKIKENEVFIIPLTDNLKTCSDGKGNCGLKYNTEYKVSFDVEESGRLESRSVTFTTESK